jgi:hypothetical protein
MRNCRPDIAGGGATLGKSGATAVGSGIAFLLGMSRGQYYKQERC